MRLLQSNCNQALAAQRLEKIIAEAKKGDRPVRTTPLPKSAKQLTADDVSGEIFTAWHDGQTIAAIARNTQWDQSTIRKYLRAAGIDTRRNPAPNQQDREIIRLHEEGQSTRQIAHIVRCSHSTAWLVISRHQEK